MPAARNTALLLVLTAAFAAMWLTMRPGAPIRGVATHVSNSPVASVSDIETAVPRPASVALRIQPQVPPQELSTKPQVQRLTEVKESLECGPCPTKPYDEPSDGPRLRTYQVESELYLREWAIRRAAAATTTSVDPRAHTAEWRIVDVDPGMGYRIAAYLEAIDLSSSPTDASISKGRSRRDLHEAFARKAKEDEVAPADTKKLCGWACDCVKNLPPTDAAVAPSKPPLVTFHIFEESKWFAKFLTTFFGNAEVGSNPASINGKEVNNATEPQQQQEGKSAAFLKVVHSIAGDNDVSVLRRPEKPTIVWLDGDSRAREVQVPMATIDRSLSAVLANSGAGEDEGTSNNKDDLPFVHLLHIGSFKADRVINGAYSLISQGKVGILVFESLAAFSDMKRQVITMEQFGYRCYFPLRRKADGPPLTRLLVNVTGSCWNEARDWSQFAQAIVCFNVARQPLLEEVAEKFASGSYGELSTAIGGNCAPPQP